MTKIKAKNKEHLLELLFTKYVPAKVIDVSSVTDMSYLFEDHTSFNQDISGWDVSNVTNMRGMFFGCSSFNQDITGWDVSNVDDMVVMFHGCVSLDLDLSKWYLKTDILKTGIFSEAHPTLKATKFGHIGTLESDPEETPFTKFDEDKARFDLIDPYFHEDLAKILTLGAVKYSDNNWQKGTLARYIAATERHLNAIKKGEMFDPESGLQHATHVGTNMMFIHWMTRTKTKEDKYDYIGC